MPTLNERDNVEPLLRCASAPRAPAVDVLIVDDASPDRTADRAEALGAPARAHHASCADTASPGSARRIATASATRSTTGTTPSSRWTPISPTTRRPSRPCSSSLAAGADLVIGSRYTAGGATPGWPRRRRALSRGASVYARLLLHLPSSDPTGGFRAFRTTLLRDCEVATVRANGFAFQLEMLHRVQRLHAIIGEVPIVFHDRHAGESKMSARIAREALRLVAELRLHPWVPTATVPREPAGRSRGAAQRMTAASGRVQVTDRR